MSEMTDIVIIGAGIIGLSIASETATKDREVVVLEKNDTFGRDQSSRSSEVIHAGIYYSPDYLKTRLCIEGNRMLYRLCERYRIPCLPCGKLFIASTEAESEALENLYYNGINNGLRLVRVSEHELKQQQPEINAVSAFFSPTSGVIDSHALMRYHVLKAKESDAIFAYRTEVTGLEKLADGWRVHFTDDEGGGSLDARVVVNCAGFYSDRIAELAGIDIDLAGYRLYLTRGEFYSVRGGRNREVSTLIYPPPEPLGPSIHVCLDVERNLRLGPYMYYTDEVSYALDEANRMAFEESAIVRALPFIGPDDMMPESAAIMGVLYAQGEPVSDFIIRHEADRGMPGLINLIGIDSPGITASPAIARQASRLILDIVA